MRPVELDTTSERMLTWCESGLGIGGSLDHWLTAVHVDVQACCVRQRGHLNVGVSGAVCSRRAFSMVAGGGNEEQL